MPEIVVKYKSQRTLEALRDFAKYFDYKILSGNSKAKKAKQISLNGITIIPADPSIKTVDLSEIFTGSSIDPSQIRNEAWRRRRE